MNKLLFLVVLIGSNSISATAQQTSGPELERTIPLVGVAGKFDHFAIDQNGDRLFAAATGNQSVEVVDLAAGKVVESLKGLGKPHGLAWVPETGRLFVADGGKAELAVFQGWPLKLVKTLPLSEDADDMVYDGATKMLYVGHGGTDAANPARIAVVDAVALTVVVQLPVASHPEALELDAEGDRIFANIADSGQIAVVDGKTHRVTQLWTLKHNKGNTPLAYDSEDGLLLVGCRAPAQLLVLNAKTGEELAAASASAGADDLFYDASTRIAYLIAGSGAVDSFALSKDGEPRPLAVAHTVIGAKTGLLVSGRRALFVGIPGANSAASVRVYKLPMK